MLTTGLATLVACDNTKRLNAIPHLFWCDQERMNAITTRLALGDPYPTLQRNSAGTQVFFQGSGSKPTVIAMSSSESARLLSPEAYLSFWDDNRMMVARGDLEKGLHFGTGFIQEIPTYGRVGFSPGSKYYFVAAPNGPTTIYAASNPGASIANVDFCVRKIYSKTDFLYVFGPEVDRGTGSNKGILGRILRSTGRSWIREADFQIPRPWAAASPYAEEDFDQWGDQLLCIDIRDEFGAKWFLYDLHARSLTDLGKAHTYSAFLDQALVDMLAT